MARLRVSSGKVWRRAGGRRGPEPALALDSAELGLPWGVDAAPPPAPDPQPPVTLSVPVRRRYAAAVYALSLAFVPLVVATATATATAEQGGDVARAGETRQYHAVTGPVLVPAAAGETITIDKWKGTQPDRLQPRPYRTQHTGAAPIVVPDVTTPAPVLSWAGTFPASQRLPARSLPHAHQECFEPVITRMPQRDHASADLAGPFRKQAVPRPPRSVLAHRPGYIFAPPVQRRWGVLPPLRRASVQAAP